MLLLESQLLTSVRDNDGKFAHVAATTRRVNIKANFISEFQFIVISS